MSVEGIHIWVEGVAIAEPATMRQSANARVAIFAYFIIF
jgi:hypothetical protein